MNSKRGSCLKKILIGVAVFILIGAVIAGYSYKLYKQAFVFESEQVIAKFQEAVPGAKVPEGYSGLLAFDYRGSGFKQDTLQAVLARTKANPTPDGFPSRILAEPSMQFTAYNFPKDSGIGMELWETKFQLEVRTSREDLSSETITKNVGGQETEILKIESKDDMGKEYLEYRLDLPQSERVTFLLISAPAADFEEELADQFLESLSRPAE